MTNWVLRIALICLMLTAVSTLAEEALKLEDDNARINYSVGYQVGGDFRRQGLELDPELVAKGIEDALSGAQPAISHDEMREILTGLQRQVTVDRRAAAKQQAEIRREAGRTFLEANKDKEGVNVTNSGLQYKVIQAGSGRSPRAGDTVRVHYRGTLVDGTEFDSSYGRGRPAEFRLDRVIKGWTEGLQLMKEGAKYELYIPPELAYGNRGRLANQMLIFEIELLEVRQSKE